MINTNHIELDIKNVEKLVSDYIQQNFSPDYTEEISSLCSEYRRRMEFSKPHGVAEKISLSNIDTFNFLKLFNKDKHESFSEMLLRLIKESGEKNSTVYTRAHIDRRHFSKIINHEDYQPSKQTVLAFAIALKLGFEKAKALLASAGFTLSNANLSDVIVSAFIENKIFDVDVVNQILYKYEQPLLGG